MNTHYSRAVRSEHSDKSPRELLQSDVTVLVGTDDESKAALELIDIENIHDLATSPVFEVARAVYKTAASGGPSGGVNRTTAVSAANRATDGDIADLSAADIEELQGIDHEDADDIRDALGVATVRDLAKWPPYRGARAILGTLTGEDAETEDGIPKELVPTARKYATEQLFYSKVYIDRRLSEPNPEAPEIDGQSHLPGGDDGGDYMWIDPNVVSVVTELPATVEDYEPPQTATGSTSLLTAISMMDSEDDESAPLKRTVVLDNSNRTGKTDYRLSVTGRVETVDDETLPPGISVTSTRADDVDESTVRGTLNSGAVGFTFSGRIEDLSLTDPSAAAVYVDGTRWIDGAPLDRTIVVDSGDASGVTSYSIAVGGDLLPVDDETLPPGIDVTWDANDEADQDAVAAAVSTGADGFRFSGDIETFTIEDPEAAVVYLDGEEIEYPSTLGSTDIALSGSGQIDIQVAQESSGFEEPAVGGVLQFSQRWVPQGLSLGQLLHSTTLAPGESTKVAVIDWSRRTRGQRREFESQRERTSASVIQNRSISEVQHGVASEVQFGGSVVSTESETDQKGGGVSGGLNIGPVSFGGSHQEGHTETETTTTAVSSSMGQREVHSSMSQKIRNSTQQHASSSRTRRASVVRETEQEESEAVRTRVITNHNHMHALSVHYYEVVQIFRTEIAPEDAKPVLFVPFDQLDFSDRTTILKHRQALKRAALDATTYHLLDVVAPADEDRYAEFSTDDRDRTIVIEGTDGDEGTDYDLSVTGTLEPIDGQALDPGIDVSWDDADTATETTASGTVWDGADGFRFSGEIEAFSVEDRSAVDVYVDGFERQGPIEHDRTIVIDSRNTQGTTDYRLKVGDGLEPVDDETLPPGVNVTHDTAGAHPDIVTGTTAEGRVSSGADGFRFSGPVETLDLDDPSAVTVYLDGEEWLATSEFIELVERLQENRTYYSQAVWQSLDRPTLAMMLEGYEIDGRSTADFVDPVPEATHGNLVAFPLSLPESVEDADDRRTARLVAWWDEWTDRNFQPDDLERDLVPLPTGGVHGEAILGRANSAEKLDITRFWDWQDSPIPQQAPQIAPVDTGSRAQDQDLTPGGFDQPIVQLQQPQQLPDPTGVGAVLDTLGQSDLFRDMSGLDAAAEVTETASRISGEGASDIADTAARTFEAASRARVAQTKTLAELAKTLAAASAGGPAGAAAANNSSFGAGLNELKKLSDGSNGTDGSAVRSDGSSSGSSDGSTDGETGGDGSNGGSSTDDGGATQPDGGDTMTPREALAHRMDPIGGEEVGPRLASLNAPLLGSSGGGSGSTNCRTNEPSNASQLVVDQTGYDVSSLTVTNWAGTVDGDDVYHFTQTPSTPNCRSPSDVTEIVLHTPGANDWSRARARRMEQNRDVSIQLAVERNGDVVQHNDVVDDLWHAGGTRNNRSVGVEIVNDGSSGSSDASGVAKNGMNVPWLNDTYYPPTKDQTEGVAQLIDWLTGSARSLGIDHSWVGLDETNDRFLLNELWDENAMYGENKAISGIWAHAWEDSDRTDGIFSALYTWLRLDAKGGSGMTQSEAWSAVKKLCKEGTGPSVTQDKGQRWVDVTDYVGSGGNSDS